MSWMAWCACSENHCACQLSSRPISNRGHQGAAPGGGFGNGLPQPGGAPGAPWHQFFAGITEQNIPPGAAWSYLFGYAYRGGPSRVVTLHPILPYAHLFSSTLVPSNSSFQTSFHVLPAGAAGSWSWTFLCWPPASDGRRVSVKAAMNGSAVLMSLRWLINVLTGFLGKPSGATHGWHECPGQKRWPRCMRPASTRANR